MIRDNLAKGGGNGKITPNYSQLGNTSGSSANALTLTIGASNIAVIEVMASSDDSARGITSVKTSAGTLTELKTMNNGKTGTNYAVANMYLLQDATSGATITVNGAWLKQIYAHKIA